MGLTVFEPPACTSNEPARERAVVASGALAATDDPGLRRIVDATRRALSTTMAAVTILHQDWQYIIAGAGIATGVNGRRTSFCGHAIIAEADVFHVDDAACDPRFAGNPDVVEGQLRFYAGATIEDRDGLPLGMVCVFDPDPRAALTPEEEATLRKAARAVVARLRDLRDEMHGAARH